MSTSFNTLDKYTGEGDNRYGLYSLPQRKKRQSLMSVSGSNRYNENMHCEFVRKEIEKIRKMRQNIANEKMKKNKIDNHQHNNRYDITGEEFQIVCEELWIDFNLWVKQYNNINSSTNMFWSLISRNLYAILSITFFVIWFRWYVGAGRYACSYGIGYGVFCFICEILRYLGEIIAILLLSIVGFCIGLLPFVIGLIIYDFDSLFPREDGEEDDGEGAEDTENETGGNHLKKE